MVLHSYLLEKDVNSFLLGLFLLTGKLLIMLFIHLRGLVHIYQRENSSLRGEYTVERDHHRVEETHENHKVRDRISLRTIVTVHLPLLKVPHSPMHPT